MAESNGQEKTEKPTSKRRRDARKEGNVFQSRDVSNVVLLLGAFSVLRLLIPSVYTTVKEYMEACLEMAGGMTGPEQISYHTYGQFLESALSCALPLLLPALLLAVLAHWTQTRFMVSFKQVRPDFKKLNPLSGLKRMFSLKSWVSVLGNLAKIVLLGVMLYYLLKDELGAVARMMDMRPVNAGAYSLSMVYELAVKVCAAFAVVAFFDYLYRRWDYERSLKMTKQEVKEEFKQTEGNPEIKGRIRRIQRQMAMSRMMQKVPQADVIIRNPTHLAIALRYDPKKDQAPVVLAKGQDELALRIVKAGEENGVAVIENRQLARAMYPSCRLDREILPEFYGAVAEILVYLYQAKGRELS